MLNFALLHWFNFNVCHFQDISGCNTSPVEGADSGDSTLVYLCSALSRDDGVFVFPSLASGEYTVVSYCRKSQQKTAVNLSYCVRNTTEDQMMYKYTVQLL